MAKLTLTDLTSLSSNEASAVSNINNNNTAIENALENTLSRDGTSPNQMGADLDMNSNRILNLPAPASDNEPARRIDVGDAPSYATAAAASASAAATSASNASTSATNASNSATQAQGYVTGLSGTSSTSVAIATGSKSFTASTGKLWVAGHQLVISSNATPANYMHGTVTSYNSSNGALVVNVLDIGGSGTLNDWNIAIAGTQGPQGSTGPSGAVGISGTPSAGQIPSWTNSTTLKGTTITGLVKGNGASDPTAATSGTDYAPATSGSGVLKGNGAGGFGTVGTGDTLTIGTIELGNASDTTVSRASAGVIAVEGVNLTPNLPITSKSAAYTTVLADANTAIYHPSSDNNARTFTIDSNANVAYPVGTTLTFINEINTVTIAITTDTLTLVPSGATGSRTLAANGMATAVKVTSTKWVISGAGLS